MIKRYKYYTAKLNEFIKFVQYEKDQMEYNRLIKICLEYQKQNKK